MQGESHQPGALPAYAAVEPSTEPVRRHGRRAGLMLDPNWTREQSYSHALELLSKLDAHKRVASPAVVEGPRSRRG